MKIDPSKTGEAKRDLKSLPENPGLGVKLHYSFNVFGDWDACIWFQADNDDQATHFIKDRIAKIPGVTKTYILPSTILREYVRGW